MRVRPKALCMETRCRVQSRSPRMADRAAARAGDQVQPARWAAEPAIAADVPACRPAGWFRDRTVIPDGLVRNQRRGKGNQRQGKGAVSDRLVPPARPRCHTRARSPYRARRRRPGRARLPGRSPAARRRSRPHSHPPPAPGRALHSRQTAGDPRATDAAPPFHLVPGRASSSWWGEDGRHPSRSPSSRDRATAWLREEAPSLR